MSEDANNEKAALEEFFACRPAPAGESSDDDDNDEDFLEHVKRDRAQRRVKELSEGQETQRLVLEAERAARSGQLMDGVTFYTQALEIEPTNVGVLSARASLCGRLNLHKATLHDVQKAGI